MSRHAFQEKIVIRCLAQYHRDAEDADTPSILIPSIVYFKYSYTQVEYSLIHAETNDTVC